MIHTTSTISAKGQVTLPSSVRKALHMNPGERITWEIVDGKLVGRRLLSLSELAGCLKFAPTGDAVPPQSEWAKAAIARDKRVSKQK